MGGSIKINPGEKRWRYHQLERRGGDRIGNLYPLFLQLCALANWPLNGSEA